jgi:hypothetical protein
VLIRPLEMVETVRLNPISFHQIPPSGRERPPPEEGFYGKVFFKRRFFSCFYAFFSKTWEPFIKTGK